MRSFGIHQQTRELVFVTPPVTEAHFHVCIAFVSQELLRCFPEANEKWLRDQVLEQLSFWVRAGLGHLTPALSNKVSLSQKERRCFSQVLSSLNTRRRGGKSPNQKKKKKKTNSKHKNSSTNQKNLLRRLPAALDYKELQCDRSRWIFLA